MNVARYLLFTRKKGKPLRLMSLPPTDANLAFHIRRAHLQVILWKSADQQGPNHLDITNYGWKIVDELPAPVYDTDVHPLQLKNRHPFYHFQLQISLSSLLPQY
jgi:hypothetical protein